MLDSLLPTIMLDYLEQRLLFRPRPLVDATPNDLGLSAGTFQGNLIPT